MGSGDGPGEAPRAPPAPRQRPKGHSHASQRCRCGCLRGLPLSPRSRSAASRASACRCCCSCRSWSQEAEARGREPAGSGARVAVRRGCGGGKFCLHHAARHLQPGRPGPSLPPGTSRPAPGRGGGRRRGTPPHQPIPLQNRVEGAAPRPLRPPALHGRRGGVATDGQRRGERRHSAVQRTCQAVGRRRPLRSVWTY
jgi:hypothetical protein